MKIVGTVPQGLPPLTMPSWDLALWRELAVPALLISVVGFVESVSVGQTLAAKRRQRIEPDQELVALGASNLGAAFTGGFPVTGGFARSVVNFDAGAQTPAAGVFTAVGILLASLLLTPALYYLPQATLAATIIVAVLSLVDFGILQADLGLLAGPTSPPCAATLLATLALGVETGLVVGVGVSLALYLLRTSRPHIAIVGLVPGTEHFRNVLRHEVLVEPAPREPARRREPVLRQRPHARGPHQRRRGHASRHCSTWCCSARPSTTSTPARSKASKRSSSGCAMPASQLHLSEVKGPVMDRLQTTDFLRAPERQGVPDALPGRRALTPELLASATSSDPPDDSASSAPKRR